VSDLISVLLTVSCSLPNNGKLKTKLIQKQLNFTFYKNVTSKKLLSFRRSVNLPNGWQARHLKDFTRWSHLYKTLKN